MKEINSSGRSDLSRSDARLTAFPRELRELVEAELEAGNSIVEIAGTFPAPPSGAYAMLRNPVSTRPRASAAGVRFFERNSSKYSGEFSDAGRVYFVLEPPLPPPPEPDMDAIREELAARERAANAKFDTWLR